MSLLSDGEGSPWRRPVSTSMIDKIVEKSTPRKCVHCQKETRGRCYVCQRYACNDCTRADYRHRCPGCVPQPYLS